MKRITTVLISIAMGLMAASARSPNNPCIGAQTTNICVTPPSVTLGTVTLLNSSVCLGGPISASTTGSNSAGSARTDTSYDNCPTDTGTPYAIAPSNVTNWWVASGPGGFTATGNGLSAAFTPTNAGGGTITFNSQWSSPAPCASPGTASASAGYTILAPQWQTNCLQEGSVSLTNVTLNPGTNVCVSNNITAVTGYTVSNASVQVVDVNNCALAVTNQVPPVVLTNWWVVSGIGAIPPSGSGLSATFMPTNGGNGTVTFYSTYSNLPPCGSVATVSLATNFSVPSLIGVEAEVEGTNTYTACVNEELEFTSTVESTNCTGLSYLWDFGDGQTNNTADPAHTYTNAGTGTYTVTLTVSCTNCASATKTATNTVNFVRMDAINVALPSTKDAVTKVAPADGTFTSNNTDTNFAGAGSGDLMVILQNCGTNTLTAAGLLPASATNRVRWQIDKDPTDGVVAGMPGLAPLTGGKTVLTPSAPGNFRVIAYCDCNNNNTWDPGEELRILRLVIVRITIQTNHSITAANNFNPGVNSVSTMNAMTIRADFLLEGGGANGRLGVDARVVLGNVGTCVGDTFTINYPVPVPAPAPPGNVAGTGTEDPDGQLNPAPGFTNPMLDSVNVLHGATATGGTSPFRGNSVPTVLGNGPGGIGELRRVNSLDSPGFGWRGIHPTTKNPWGSTQGANLFREWMVAFSTDFTRNYVVMGGSDWTVTVTGTSNAGGTWVSNGATVTLPGGVGNPSPFATVFSPATSGDASGAQMLGPSFVSEYLIIYAP